MILNPAMKKSMLFLLFTFILSSCAGPSVNRARYESIVNSWLNNDINKLTDAWGYPTTSFIAPNGNKVFVFQRKSTSTSPVIAQQMPPIGNNPYFGPTTIITGGDTSTYWCNTYFEVNSTNTIIRWRIEGNSCY
jgi:hypothetical protein